MPDAPDQPGRLAEKRAEPASDGRLVRRRRRCRRFKWPVRLGVLLAIVGVFSMGLDRLFYYPSKTVYYTPDELGLEYEDLTFQTADGLHLSGWFLPARGTALGTVIHFHGNAENISNHFVASCWLVPAGYNVFIFDYRGYGRSTGRVSRAGTIRDGHAALDYVLSRRDVDPRRIVALGQSLGGAVATVVAAERQEIRAVVLDGTFSSYRRIAALHLRRLLHSRWLADGIARVGLSGGYEPQDYVARIAPRPLLVIVSLQDEICFPESGRELFEAAAEPKELVLLPEGAHLEAVAGNIAGVQQRILRFLEHALSGTP